MSLTTYILLVATINGLAGHFRPEDLGRVASAALFIVLLEFLAIKAGCYLLNITTSASPGGTNGGASGGSPVTDLVAYGGYKFVG